MADSDDRSPVTDAGLKKGEQPQGLPGGPQLRPELHPVPHLPPPQAESRLRGERLAQPRRLLGEGLEVRASLELEPHAVEVRHRQKTEDRPPGGLLRRSPGHRSGRAA